MIQTLNEKQSFWLYTFITLIMILIIGSFSYSYFKKNTLKNEFKKIEDIQKNLAKDIDYYFTNNISNITEIISKNTNLINDPNKIESTNLTNYPDVLFILPDGKVTFSLKKEVPVGINIYQNYKNSLLTSLHDQTKISTQVTISNFDFLPNSKEPSLFISFPLYNEKKYIGNIFVKINNNEIADIIKKYFPKLSNTGDLLVAKRSDKNSLIIFPSKYNLESAFSVSFNLNEKNPINLALFGNESTNIMKVYDTEVLNSKALLTQVPWAISVEENKQEIMGKYKILKNLLWAILILTLISLFIFIYITVHIIVDLLNYYKSSIIFVLTIILLISAFISLGFYLKKYNKNKIKLTNQSFIQTKLQVQHVSSLLQQNLNDISTLNNSISLDLTTGNLNENNIVAFLQNTINKYPYIAGFYISYLPNEYKADTKLFSQYFVNKEGTIDKGQLDTVYDYTNSPWYNKTIQATNKQNLWFEPTIEKGIINELSIMNTTPFYTNDKQKIKGIVSILYSYSAISDLISLLGRKKLNNSIIFTKDGNLIFYHDQNLITEETSFKNIIYDINPKLGSIQEKGSEGYSGYTKFEDKKNNEEKWAFYESIPTTGWTLTVFYPNKYFNIFDKQQYKYLSFIILLISALLLLLSIIITKIYTFDLKYLKIFTYTYCFIILLNLLSILFIYYNYPTSEINDSIITNRLELDQLIEKEMQRFSNESFITTKAGINLKALKVDDGGTFLAYLWQKLNKDTQKEITPGVEIVNMEPYDGLYFYLGEGIKNTINNIETTRWLCQANAYQEVTLQSTYPFDIKHFKFILSPIDNTKKILLVPDMKDYPSLDPESYPGFGEDVKIENFNILKSYFSYDNEYSTQQTQITKPKNLCLNILLQREFLPIFISYLLPLIIILITLFCTFIIKYIRDIDEMTTIAAYSGLLFTLVLLHQGYRTSINPSTISFLEYFIFLDYLFIIFAFLDTFIPKEKINTQAMMLTFWPVFLTFLFGITIKLFIF